MIGIFSKVIIKDIETESTVVAVLQEACGVSYKVRYFLNGKQEEAWLFGDELEKVPTL
jgi:hypothetical protein